MNTQHTPGPWRVGNSFPVNGVPMPTIVQAHGARWGVAYATDQDARLIAAAPDLLAALLDVMKVCTAHSFKGNSDEREAFHRAGLAIAKAVQS